MKIRKMNAGADRIKKSSMRPKGDKYSSASRKSDPGKGMKK